MTKVLHITASARHQDSVSDKLSASVIEKLGATDVTHRDVSSGIPHLDDIWVGATFTPPEHRTEAQSEKLSLSDELVAEVEAADVIVIGTPIYNFSLPSTLKAWIDHLARVGVTFHYTENGPVGHLSGKRVIVAVASGGVPIGSDADHLTPYLRTVLGFIGLTDVEFIGAAGADGLESAQVQIEALAA